MSMIFEKELPIRDKEIVEYFQELGFEGEIPAEILGFLPQCSKCGGRVTISFSFCDENVTDDFTKLKL